MKSCCVSASGGTIQSPVASASARSSWALDGATCALETMVITTKLCREAGRKGHRMKPKSKSPRLVVISALLDDIVSIKHWPGDKSSSLVAVTEIRYRPKTGKSPPSGDVVYPLIESIPTISQEEVLQCLKRLPKAKCVLNGYGVGIRGVRGWTLDIYPDRFVWRHGKWIKVKSSNRPN